jgi:hypothetical protein
MTRAMADDPSKTPKESEAGTAMSLTAQNLEDLDIKGVSSPRTARAARLPPKLSLSSCPISLSSSLFVSHRFALI